MEEIMAGLQRRHENEVADLHASVERLLKVGCGFFFFGFFFIFHRQLSTLYPHDVL